jgi:uncharacterized protein (DUF2147 family)
MAASLLLVALLVQGPESLLAGPWTNPSGSVIIMIGPCADGGLCGVVQWSSAKAAADAARAGTATLVGTEILHGFVPLGGNRWKGRLFVPDLNKKSTAEVRLLNGDRLQVRGCAVGRLLCKSQVWTRAEPR